MKRLLLLLVVIAMYCTHDPIEEYNPTLTTSQHLQARDSIACYLESEGWTRDAAYLIASFDVDLLDQSDTAEYALYCAYMED
jgi:hypothetical protein